jgi:molybdopterin-guanine dinucleotide biosynthesis protein A
MISGIILAGGQSERMGTDKRHLSVGEKSLLAIALEKIKKVTDEVIIVTSWGEKSSTFHDDPPGIRVVNDLERRKGPLIGLLTGLQKMSHPCGLVIPCDLPFLSVDFLKLLRDQAGNRLAVIPRWGGQIYPFPAIYSRSLVPKLITWKASGNLSLKVFLQSETSYVKWVEENEILAFGPPVRTFHNINTRDDLRIAQEWLTNDLAVHHRVYRVIAEGVGLKTPSTEKGGRGWKKKQNYRNHQRPIKNL